MSESIRSEKKGKRVVFKSKGLVTIEEYDLEPPRPNQISVETVSTLISPGTETAFLMALPNTSGKFPMYPGYSNVGVVSALGSDNMKFEVGDRVVSRGHHASHIVMDQDNLIRIPNSLSFDEAVFFALGSIALQGIRKANIELGESVMVIGQGLVGNLALQLAKLSGGMPVIGVDYYDYRLDISERCGADNVLNPSNVDVVEAVRNATRGNGADVVVEASGNPQAIPTALELAGRFGRVVLLGSTRGTTEVNFYSTIHRKGVRVIGAHESTRPRHESSRGLWTSRDDSLLVLELMSKGRLKVGELVSAKMSFQEAARAYNRLVESKEDTLGIILQWK